MSQFNKKNQFAALALSALFGNKEASILAAAEATARAVYLAEKDGNMNALTEEFKVYIDLLAIVQTGKHDGKKASTAVINSAIAVTAAFRAGIDAAPFLSMQTGIVDSRQKKRGSIEGAESLELASRTAFIAAYTGSMKEQALTAEEAQKRRKEEKAAKEKAEAETAEAAAQQEAERKQNVLATEREAAADAFLVLSKLDAAVLDALSLFAKSCPTEFALDLEALACKKAEQEASERAGKGKGRAAAKKAAAKKAAEAEAEEQQAVALVA